MRGSPSSQAQIAAILLLLSAWGCSTPGTSAEDITGEKEEDTTTVVGCDGPYGCCPGGNLSNCRADLYCEAEGCEAQCVVASCAYGETCEFTLLQAGQPCNLDDLCSWNAACNVVGVCSGSPADCDDENPCTMDSCDSATGECVNEAKVAAGCDDGNPCSVGDACNEDGVCKPGAKKDCAESGIDSNDCIDFECDEETGECTVEVMREEGDDCIDGDPCTWQDACDSEGGCIGTPHECEKLFPDPCKTGICNESKPDDGSDGAASCLPKWLVEGTSCADGDGNKCTIGDKCAPIPDGNGAMECKGTLVDCDDDNVCTDAYCDLDTGECTKDFLNIPCDDGNECTVEDYCEEGSCEAGEEKDCGDGVECTVDMCDAGECKHVPNPLACNDDLWCNGEESCDAETGCVAGEAPGLEDGVDCTQDLCDEENDVVTHTPDNSVCDDNDVCNGAETCDAAQGCLVEDGLECNDDIDCTEDSCDAAAGCLFASVDSECDDGDGCSADSCDAKTGCVYVAFPDGGVECCAEDDDCDDANICTVDTCGGDFHCQFVNKDDGAECTDGLKCTLDDACLAGLCTGLTDDCDDEIECTADSCDGEAGCMNMPDSEFCDDQDVCTGTEECDPDADGPGSGCIAIDALDCDDDVACTIDACDAIEGCSSVPQDADCDDNNQCTLDVCHIEQDCLHTFFDGSDEEVQCCQEEDAECSDGIPCTKDTCNLETHQCEAAEMANGQACSPNSLCKMPGTCQNGICEAPDKVCEDNVACTTNGCEPDSGCQYDVDDQFCNDSNDCTSESCNINDDCVYADLDGQDCDDNNAATVDDTCVEDLCTGLPDPDADGIANEGYDSACINGQMVACNDNCPEVPNSNQADEDGDGTGDACTDIVLVDSGQDLEWAYYGDSADIDGDGDIDVLGNYGGADIRIFRNDGQGTFTIEKVDNSTGAHWVTLADIDGDGTPDLIFGKNNDGSGRVVLNDGDGNFTGLVTSFGGSERCQFEFYNTYPADMDGDDDLDLVTRAPDCGAHIYRNDTAAPGTTTLTQLTGEVIAAPKHAGVIVFDVNGDDAPDILLAWDSGNLRLMKNDGAGGMSEVQNLNIGGLTEHRGMAAADFDGDGDLDAIYAADKGWPAGQVNYLENNNGLLVNKSTVQETGNLARSFTAADMDLDGHPDIVTAGAGGTVVLYNSGFATFEAGDSFSASTHAEVADFNGDKLPDLFLFGEGGCKLLLSEYVD
jgi:hypothetical protein